MDSDERRRARRLHRQAWSGQVELVRYAGAEKIAVPIDVTQSGGLSLHLGMSGEMDQVARKCASSARKHANDIVSDPFGVVTGILERLPARLEEETILRIHNRRLLRRIAEEGGVESV